MFLSRYTRRFLLVPRLWRKGFTGQNHKPPELRRPHQQLLCACWNSLTVANANVFLKYEHSLFFYFFPPPPLIIRITRTQTYCLFPGSPLWTWESFWWKQSKGKQLKAVWEGCRFVHDGCLVFCFLKSFYTLCFVLFFFFIHYCGKTRDAAMARQPIHLLVNHYWPIFNDWWCRLLVSKNLIRRTNQTPQKNSVYLFRVLSSFSLLSVVLKVWKGDRGRGGVI